MKKVLIMTAAVSFTATMIFTVLNIIFCSKVLPALAISSGTVFYHFAMRLAVGLGIDAVLHNRVNYRRRWFAPRAFEAKLYKALRLRQWKKHIPTYAPENFDISKHSPEELVQVSCQAEIVHEVIMLLSFVPVLFSVVFDELAVFIVTSVLAAMADSVFVMLQRFNRPRLMRLIQRKIEVK